MRLLLDTCALLWLADEQERLTESATRAIHAAAGALYVSAISAFEIGVKVRQGKLELPLFPDAWYPEALKSLGFAEIPISGRIALRATRLAPIHRDPCDRIIIATALEHGFAVVSADPVIAKYPDVKVIW